MSQKSSKFHRTLITHFIAGDSGSYKGCFYRSYE